MMTLAAGWMQPALLRWPVAIVTAASTGFVTTMFMVTAAPPTFEEVAMALDSAGAAFDFLNVDPASVVIGLVSSILTMVGVGLAPSLRVSRYSAAVVGAGCCALALVATTSRVWAIGAAAPAWSGGVFAAMTRIDVSEGTAGPAPPPLLRPVSPASDGDVVLIVDESIGGHYLDLNRPGAVMSGLLPTPTGVEVANFGIAAAAANFSVGTNYVLRTGGTRASYLKRAASIWAYAHRAGYRTVHIFAQSAPGLQNLMTPAEYRQIDRYIRLDGTAPEQRDHVVARLLRRLMHNGTREFIYVNKVGAHYAASRYYPASERIYRPTLSQGRSVGSYLGPKNTTHWCRYRNDYRNAVRWNVGGFFKIALSQGLPRGTTIIYTSDHGEAMHERGLAGRMMHGNSEKPFPEEGAVPLVVVTASATADARWRQAAAAGLGQSHYRIFPSLLTLFGYDRSRVRALFGPDLLARDPDPMTFNSHFYARFGTRPAWHRVIARDLLNDVGLTCSVRGS
jgi:hypothetical protein